MADELTNVQVQQGTNPLWGTMGAAIGGLGTYYAVDKFTKPKYGTYADLINEKNDVYETTLKEAPEADKKFLEAVKEVRSEYQAADKTYEDKVKALMEGGKAAELPENDESITVLNNAKKDLEAKKNALIEAKMKEFGGVKVDDKKIAELKAQRQSFITKRRPVIRDINTELHRIAADNNALAEEFKKLKTEAENAEVALNTNPKEKAKYTKIIKEKNAKMADIRSKLAKNEADIAKLAEKDALGFGNNAVAKEKFVKHMQETVQNIQLALEKEKPTDYKALKPSQVIAIQQAIDEKKAKLIEENKQRNEYYKNKIEEFKKLPKEEQEARAGVLKRLQTLYDKTLVEKSTSDFAQDLIKTETDKLNARFESYEKIYKEIIEAKNANKPVTSAVKKLPAAQKEILSKSLNKDWTVADFEAILPNLRATQTQKAEAIKSQVNNYVQLVKEYGEGVKVAEVNENGKKVVRLFDKDGNIITSPFKHENIRQNIIVPDKGTTLEVIDNKLSEVKKPITDLRAKAEQSIAEADYKKEADAVKVAEENVQKAKDALPTAEKMTKEKAEEAVCKELNVANKMEYIKGQVKTKSDNLIKEYGDQMVRKHGFEGHFGLKLGASIATGAVILGAIFNALAPKKNA